MMRNFKVGYKIMSNKNRFKKGTVASAVANYSGLPKSQVNTIIDGYIKYSIFMAKTSHRHNFLGIIQIKNKLISSGDTYIPFAHQISIVSRELGLNTDICYSVLTNYRDFILDSLKSGKAINVTGLVTTKSTQDGRISLRRSAVLPNTLRVSLTPWFKQHLQEGKI